MKWIFLVPVLLACAAAEPVRPLDVPGSLARWRVHILEHGNLAATEFDSDDFRQMLGCGPGILPEVVAAYSKEQDVHVLYYLRALIRRLGHFTEFAYSTEPMKIGDRDMEYHGVLPMLNVNITPGAPGAPTNVPEQRDQLVRWWAQRDSFLKRATLASSIRAITGSTPEEYRAYTAAKSREFDKIIVNGIYNLPVLLQLVADDNNPIAFMEFLRCADNGIYDSLSMTGDRVLNAKKAGDAYPNREDKVSIVCAWWKDKRETFDGLHALQESIDAEIARIGPGKP